MKKFIKFCVVMVAFLATSCNFDDDNNGINLPLRVSFQEKTGSEILTTRFEYNEIGLPSGETQTLNGVTVYNDTDYEYDETNWTMTCIRTYAQGGVRERRVRSFNNGWFNGEHKLEAFRLGAGGSETEPVELWEQINLSTDRITSIESLKNGVHIIQNNYVYDGKNVTYNYTETSPEYPAGRNMVVTETYLDYQRLMPETKVINIGNTISRFTKYIYSNTSLLGYETYVGGNDTTGTLAEKEGEYEAKPSDGGGIVESWQITRYDEEGKNPVVTTVSAVWEYMTFSF